MLSGGRSNFEDPGSDSVVARAALEDATGVSPDVSVLALVETEADVRTSPEALAMVESVAAEIGADREVADVAGWHNTRNPAFVSTDGNSTFLAVSLKPLSDKESEEAGERIQWLFADNDSVAIGGPVIVGPQVTEQVESDLQRAELLAFPLVFLLSLFVFRGLVAASLPLIAGMVSIVGAFLVLRLTNTFTDLSVFALNLVIGVGLGLAIDYSLFIVSRYRDELARVGPGARGPAKDSLDGGSHSALQAPSLSPPPSPHSSSSHSPSSIRWGSEESRWR